MKGLNVVDSSGWLEYLADTPRAALFAPAIEAADRLIVPVLVLYEVVKKVRRERGDDAALQVTGLLQSGRFIDIDASLALDAARLDLPLADSLIYAMAQREGALLWTQDEDFKNLPGVKYFPKKESRSEERSSGGKGVRR